MFYNPGYSLVLECVEFQTYCVMHTDLCNVKKFGSRSVYSFSFLHAVLHSFHCTRCDYEVPRMILLPT
jgi:hypothetical protein